MTKGTGEGEAPAEVVAPAGANNESLGSGEGPLVPIEDPQYNIVEWRQSELSEWFEAHIDSMEKAVEGWHFINRIDEQVQVAKGRYLQCVEKYIDGGLRGFCKKVDLPRSTAYYYMEIADMAEDPKVSSRLDTLGPEKTYLIEKAPDPKSLYKWIDAKKEPPTRHEIIQKVREQRINLHKQKLEAPDRPKGVYDIIVIDPPWPLPGVQYEGRDRSSIYTRLTERPYLTMSLDDIRAMEIPAADDCILWLWVPNGTLREAFTVLDAWGFTYRTLLTWIKNRMGLGYWLRGQTEQCMLATKGTPIWTNKTETTWLEAPMREDSRKPDEFYDMVARICIGRKLDMFSREKRDNWDQRGDERDKF